MRRLLAVYALSVVLNYVWELAQTPLYSEVGFPAAFVHCFVAALGDGLLVLLILIAVAGTASSLDWYMRPTLSNYVAMAAAGLVVGIAVEWWGLHIVERWQYSELMPLLPWIEIGISPLVQMLALPPVIFALIRRTAGK